MTRRQELKLYDQRTVEVQSLRAQNQDLLVELSARQSQLDEAYQQIDHLEQQVQKLTAANQVLSQRVADLTVPPDDPPAPPAFVKPNTPRRRGRPGRKAGHPAALRPMPEHIDRHQDVPLPLDDSGRASCPHCNCQLLDLREHDRLVEDLLPMQLQVTCYHTASGWCPHCRKRIESRAAEQPPAADVPHGQLGLNALALAGALRVHYRLPFRQISQLFADVPGLSVSAGAIARQVQRLGRWLEGDYRKIQTALRAGATAHLDETSWRINGQNAWLWLMTSPSHTFYHIDRSRGGKVVKKLLGEAYGGTLSCDFYSAYNDSECRKQRCLVHLLRELKETAAKHPAFASGGFCRRCQRLVRDMLKLKGQWDNLNRQEYERKARRMEQRLDELANGRWDEEQARRLANRLQRHRGELTVFLWRKEVDPDNNAAERGIRPEVVARKISGGSRSEEGAKGFSILASVIRTICQQALPLVESIKSLLMASWAGKSRDLLNNTS